MHLGRFWPGFHRGGDRVRSKYGIASLVAKHQNTSFHGARIFCGKCWLTLFAVRLQRGTSPPLGNPQLSEGDERFFVPIL